MNAPVPRQDRRADDQVLRAVQSLQRSLDNRHTENSDRLKGLEAKVDLVLSGFPEEDPEGHRRYHEAMIRKAEERARFWSELRIKLAERGVWAVLTVLVGVLLWYAKGELRK